MGQEFFPFGGGEFTVFFAGPGRAAAGDERPVVGDDVLGVDRLWRNQISQLSECLGVPDPDSEGCSWTLGALVGGPAKEFQGAGEAGAVFGVGRLEVVTGVGGGFEASGGSWGSCEVTTMVGPSSRGGWFDLGMVSSTDLDHRYTLYAP
jgi:hypothetical protein